MHSGRKVLRTDLRVFTERTIAQVRVADHAIGAAWDELPCRDWLPEGVCDRWRNTLRHAKRGTSPREELVGDFVSGFDGSTKLVSGGAHTSEKGTVAFARVPEEEKSGHKYLRKKNVNSEYSTSGYG